MKVKVLNFEYAPGDKWSCGVLNFDAKTPLGLLTWREIVPGPRHGDDSAEVTVTLDGKELSIYEPGTSTCYQDFDFPDFEAPNKDGKRATAFANDGPEEIAETLGKWLDDNKSHEEFERVLEPDEDDYE